MEQSDKFLHRITYQKLAVMNDRSIKFRNDNAFVDVFNVCIRVWVYHLVVGELNG